MSSPGSPRRLVLPTEAERLGVMGERQWPCRPGRAAVVGLVSQGMSLGELALLRRWAMASGIAEDAIAPIVEAADAALSATG
jgi:hypothetical protein